ncbi:hypothetical protein J2792_000678 [Novosphingobium capsulatum]|uniref:EF-hand domain-containing protein n=1 Tax=Novosphingobium capsulatum TaxID=13688 RepID=A0ABU1MHM8_9SPHN|nr:MULTISPECIES: hypothetical protein [Novosphingobium]KPF55607.1 hypothetical protein IP65_05895 [Novosphingobium sp. AAP1]MBB3357664.1 hypothetical protein [Novosphingobium sp. BK256]MBB3373672.1 hypothetical protein [Novosphingobium sp. BK280]MBB3378084.1 hypothetical protein [Novosphingobium sp. BK258]MBB3420131.1 hypothetical protein [Novosphingobium sp. BK267]
MNRTLVGALGALMLVAAGVFWWQGHAAVQKNPALAAVPSSAPSAEASEDDTLPTADGDGLQGPALPHASEASREQRRFDRFDKDRDGRITRNELLAPRAKDFRKLDVDGNNLLSFDEWAVSTENKFKSADANGDGALTRAEFVTTKQKTKKASCACK